MSDGGAGEGASPAVSPSRAASLPSRPSPWNRRSLWGLLGLAAVAWALLQTGLPGADLVNPGGWGQLREFLAAALRPALGTRFLRLAGEAALATLAFAVCGTFLSLILGTVGGILASEAWWRSVFRARHGAPARRWRAPWLTVRAMLAVPRAIHEIVWGLFFIALVGLDPLVGVLAIAIPYGAITAKVFSEILDEAARDSLDALLDRGVRPDKAFLYSLVPEAFPDLLSYGFYRFECSIRSAAVLGIIGAGGLGYQIFLSLQALRYREMWTFLLALVVLTGLTDAWSGWLRRRMGSPHRMEIGRDLGRRSRIGSAASDGTSDVGSTGAAADAGGSAAATGATAPAETSDRRSRDPVLTGSVALAAGLVVFSFWWVGPHLGQVAAPRTLEMLARLVGEALPPSLDGLTPGRLVGLSAQTLAMSVLAVTGAALGGVVLSFPAATNFLLPGGILLGEGGGRVRAALGTAAFALTRGLLLFLRAVPAPIWALVLLFVLFPGIVPGAVALGLYTLGVLGRLMAEVTENLDARPLKALKAQGASGLQVFLYGVLPATAPQFLSYVLYRWEVTIRATVMVGLVGAGGLGRLLTEQLSSFAYDAIVVTLGCYVILTFLVDMISALVRRDLR